MKNFKHHLDDSLRGEYSRSDFGEVIQGKYANTQVQFSELVHLLLVCIGEDEGIKFTHHSPGNRLAGRKPGDWTYDLDNANQVTLRYWIDDLKNLEESISNPPSVIRAEERMQLQDLLRTHVQRLKNRIASL